MKKILSAFVFFLPVISYAQWSAALNISTGADTAGLNENMASCLAASGDTLHVVWCDHRSTGSSIYYTHSLDTGLTWSSAIALTDTSGNATFPAIAVSGSTVHVAWMDLINGQRASFYKHSADGGMTWGQTICVDSTSAFWPGLAASGSLVVMSINKQFAVGNTEVYFRRSIDNGVTWDSLQQISNANDRSEDPAIAALGSHVYLSWNDKRSGVMQIYYRHSSDAGLTWGPETALTNAVSPNTCYTTMVCANGPFVDVAYGYNAGNFDVWLRQSADSGMTFSSALQLTDSTTAELYPFETRDNMNIHVVFPQVGTGVNYLNSGDGGISWSPSFNIGAGGQPYVAYTGCTVHVIWVNARRIYYRRNPTGNGNCLTTGIKNLPSHTISFYPDPASNEIIINGPLFTGCVNVQDAMGRTVLSRKPNANNRQPVNIDVSKLIPGIYFITLTDEKNNCVFAKFVKL